MLRQLIFNGLLLALLSCSEGEPSGFSGNQPGRKDQKAKENADNDEGNNEDDKKSTSSKTKGDLDDDIDTDSGSTDDSDIDLGTGKNDDIETDDAEKVAKIPGVEVIRVGVNFEDLGFSDNSDKDYNDAVLCFEGNFKVEGTSVVSTKSQTVKGSTYSASGCRHKVKVQISHSDGSKENDLEFDSRNSSQVSMIFKIGSKLEVFMTPYDGCSPGVQRSMHENIHARVAPGVCNTTGN